MSGAPTCKLCHTAHWTREPCKFPNANPAIVPQYPAPAPCRECAVKDAEIAALRNQIVTIERNHTVTIAPDVTSLVTTPSVVTKRNRAEYMRAYRAKNG